MTHMVYRFDPAPSVYELTGFPYSPLRPFVQVPFVITHPKPDAPLKAWLVKRCRTCGAPKRSKRRQLYIQCWKCAHAR